MTLPAIPALHAPPARAVSARELRAADQEARADVVLEETVTTTWQEHAFLQPEAGIAFLDEQERLVVETAGQWLVNSA